MKKETNATVSVLLIFYCSTYEQYLKNKTKQNRFYFWFTAKTGINKNCPVFHSIFRFFTTDEDIENGDR